MGQVVNLRSARKRRVRDEKAAAATARAAKFGRTKAERQAQEREARMAARKLDDHRRDGADGQ